MSALREVYYFVHGTAVWFAWFVITGTPFHDRSYGELRRLGTRELVRHVASMGLVVGVLGVFFLSMPDGFAEIYLSALGIGVVSGGLLLLTTLTLTKLLDVSLTYG